MTGEFHDVLAGAATGLNHVTGFANKEFLQYRPDRRMVAVKRRRIKTAVRRNRPAIPSEFHDIFSHGNLQDLSKPTCYWFAPRETIKAVSRVASFTLSADGVYALNAYIPSPATNMSLREAPLTNHSPTKSVLPQALALTLLIGAFGFPSLAAAQSAAAEGQKIAFDRGKGNCLTCHDIKGGDLPGSIGPPLKDIKSKYPDRNDLVAIVSDETKRNPQTVMPPFGRNRILTEKEIDAVVDFLQTL
jgi:sulfur-oxidizing protein SoxX